ncbi:MAG: hypothetical protein DCE89_04540 [Betaproteobacteria bacterium]|nr:MAG: hypothetical protein DCE89_04540 [Betaproteobacteria bacterium]
MIEIDKRISRLQALRSELQRLRAKCLVHNTIAQCEIIKTSLII